ncbi:unnamed protein product [Owenia fusiformis]|uniref:Uncharacterized protein n=1 Tax=Owenia fusiformis TaxID=6347 RepID=A0A8J1UKZ7_OWEFU|nr:unnamed protein product [Owenia fusiformis]
MADSASELESDTSSIDGGPTAFPRSPGQLEQLQKRVESLQQENRVLKMEVDTCKLKIKNLIEENRQLRKASVTIQARAEQEEEFISNTLLKKIQALKKEKETLAMNYEQEEEYLTNDLSRKLFQLRQEKVELEQTLEKEQEYQVNKLMRKIEKLESETRNKQSGLEQLKREKVELENALEQEQEALVNRLWKKMDKLEAEKRYLSSMLQGKLESPLSAQASPREMDTTTSANSNETARNLTQNINTLRSEVSRLRNMLRASQIDHEEKMGRIVQDERHLQEENIRLQRKLQMEVERREALCRHLSESESSLEMDDERHFNEMTKHDSGSVKSEKDSLGSMRQRTVSSPIPYQSPNSSTSSLNRPLSPGLNFGPVFNPMASPMKCSACGQQIVHSSPSHLPSTSPPMFSHLQQKPRPSPDKFVKPAIPPSEKPKT